MIQAHVTIQLPDLTLDYPNAHAVIKELAGYAVAQQLLAAAVFDELESAHALINDAKKLNAGKKMIREFVEEYLHTEVFREFDNAIKLVDKALHFEVIKQMVSLALDLNDRQRELSSIALTELIGSQSIARESVEQAFDVLLERVEDLALDVPKVLQYLSCFIARAIDDEALTPSFLIARDLHPSDLGAGVLKRASILLERRHEVPLSSCWGFSDFDEDDESAE